MNTGTLYVILGVANIPVYIFLGKLFFGDWHGFFECLKFWFTPDILSAFRGDFWEDWWSEFKLFVFVGLCVILVHAEATGIRQIFF